MYGVQRRQMKRHIT